MFFCSKRHLKRVVIKRQQFTCHLQVLACVVCSYGHMSFLGSAMCLFSCLVTCSFQGHPHVFSLFIIHVPFFCFAHVFFISSPTWRLFVWLHVSSRFVRVSIFFVHACPIRTTTYLKLGCYTCPYITCGCLYRSISSQNNQWQYYYSQKVHHNQLS